MVDGSETGKIALENERIVQASVMDEHFIMVIFSNGSSALVPSEEIKKFVVSSEGKSHPQR